MAGQQGGVVGYNTASCCEDTSKPGYIPDNETLFSWRFLPKARALKSCVRLLPSVLADRRSHALTILYKGSHEDGL